MARILLVDDSVTDRHMYKSALQNVGHDVIEAGSVDQGLDLMNDVRFDLVLMDVVMEGSSGFQATRKLSKDPETSRIPVIIISSKGHESDRIWGLRQGAIEYLVKPINTRHLIETVQSVLKIKPVNRKA